MAFNFDSCPSLAASKSSIFASTTSNFASVSDISVRCFAFDRVNLADIRLSAINILKGLSRSHRKTIKDHFLESFLERARNRVCLAWRHHVSPLCFYFRWFKIYKSSQVKLCCGRYYQNDLRYYAKAPRRETLAGDNLALPLIFFNLLRWNLSEFSQLVTFVLPII